MSNHDMENPSVETILADDLQKGWDDSERLPDRVASYSTLKERTMQFVDWGLDGGIPVFTRADTKLFRKLQHCGQYLLFRQYALSRVTRLIGACSCKEHLLCAFCASRRGVRNAVAYKERVDHLLQITEEGNPQQLMLLTFTVKNGPDLWERFTHLRNSMKILLKRRNNSNKGQRYTEFVRFNGGVMAYEFKRGSGENLWHPHIHMLCMAEKGTFIDHHLLKQEWLEITGDSSVVNIERVQGDNAFLEVFAYALKFSEMEHADRWHAFGVLKGERLISSFGNFRGVEVDESPTDDMLETDEPWLDLLFTYYTNRGYDNGRVIGEYRPKFDLAA